MSRRLLRQRIISRTRIMRVFTVSEDSWTKKKICELSGLSWRTVSRYVPGLVSEGYLTATRAKDNRTKIYKVKKPYGPASVVLYGSREWRQAKRLQTLGFEPLLIQYPRGRRRHDALKRDKASFNLADRIITLYEKGGDQAISPLHKLGLHFKHGKVLTLSIPGQSLTKLRKALQVQESRHGLIQG